MRCICILLIISLSFTALPATAIEQFDFGNVATIELLLERAVAHRQIAGGLVVVGNRDGIIFTAARGRVNASPQALPIDEHTIFDIASLTKVIATTSAVMKLVEDGRIALNDPLVQWFPEFQGSGREDITILNLLTHTSGLDDNPLPAVNSLRAAILRAANQKYNPRPGSRFNYADINFILLAELVQRVSGIRLDAFCRERIFSPLDLHETMFLPPQNLVDHIAPTDIVGGLVQDQNARRLGGVAGHAGLFSSAADLSRFARMIMNRGTLDGVRIMSEQAVTAMTSPHFCSNGAVTRGLGWDIDSPYSAPRGNNFSGSSFGHTGYSGSSIWIDPQRNLFVILLTIRLDYRDVPRFNQLRRDVSTLAGAGFMNPDSFMGLLPVAQPILTDGDTGPRPVRTRVTAREVHQRSHLASKRIVKIARMKRTARSAKASGRGGRKAPSRVSSAPIQSSSRA